jgi:hypothetical protein
MQPPQGRVIGKAELIAFKGLKVRTGFPEPSCFSTDRKALRGL